MRLAALLAATASLAFATTASAQDSYVNIGAEALDFAGTSGNVVARYGYNFAEYFAVEGEGRLGLLEDDDDFKIDYGVAAYGVVKAPVSEQFDIFGRLGYHYTDSDFGDADGLAFGGGVQFNFGADAMSGVRIEYTNLDGDGGSADVYGVSYVRRF